MSRRHHLFRLKRASLREARKRISVVLQLAHLLIISPFPSFFDVFTHVRAVARAPDAGAQYEERQTGEIQLLCTSM